GRRRPYRAADRRQGPQPRRQRRPLPLASLRRVLFLGVDGGPRPLLRPGARPGVAGRAVLVGDDEPLAPLPGEQRLRPEDPAGGAGIPRRLARGPGRPRRELCRPPLLTALPTRPAAAFWGAAPSDPAALALPANGEKAGRFFIFAPKSACPDR